ncbi:MAG TPA: hemolysin [Rikenellaceae bacterium]|nr:hemolysin [Rikenellaceae bacterium]
MEPVILPIDRKLIIDELSSDKFIRNTRKGDNKLYEVTAQDSPHTMREIGRLREISFRLAGGGTGKPIDIDEFDTDGKNPYKQLIVWDPKDLEIIGGYRYIKCSGLDAHHMATSELFTFSKEFTNDYMPFTIELGRSFIQPNYQSTNIRRKGLYALDNLWDGLGALVLRYPHIKYFFGKVTMYSSYNMRARNTLLNFLSKYFSDEKNLVKPIKPLEYDISNPYFEELFSSVDYKEGYKVLSKEIRSLGENIPPLINSYMNLSPSMKVFGTAINDGFGGVEETGIMINISDIYPEKIERYITPLQRLAARFQPKWWKNPILGKHLKGD